MAFAADSALDEGSKDPADAILRMRWLVLLVSLLLVPVALPARAAPPIVGSYSTFTLAQFQSVVNDILGIPEVAAALPDGSVLRFTVRSGDSYQGTVSGGAVTLAPGSTGDATLALTADQNTWGSLMNACDRANTAKIAVRDRYVGIDGAAAAKAAANGIRTGRFDAQLAAQRPTAGATFSCFGASPTLQSETMRDAFFNGDAFFDKTVLTGEIEGRRYIINTLGAIEGQLPSGWLVAATHAAFGNNEYFAAASRGTVPVPDACKVDSVTSAKWWATYVVATCLKDRRDQGAS